MQTIWNLYPNPADRISWQFDKLLCCLYIMTIQSLSRVVMYIRTQITHNNKIHIILIALKHTLKKDANQSTRNLNKKIYETNIK